MTELDDVYEERNNWVLATLKTLYDAGQEVGWRPVEKDEDERMDEEDEEDQWIIVWGLLPTGEEVSAHLTKNMLPEFLEQKQGYYDGYEPEENYKRIMRYLKF